MAHYTELEKAQWKVIICTLALLVVLITGERDMFREHQDGDSPNVVTEEDVGEYIDQLKHDGMLELTFEEEDEGLDNDRGKPSDGTQYPY